MSYIGAMCNKTSFLIFTIEDILKVKRRRPPLVFISEISYIGATCNETVSSHIQSRRYFIGETTWASLWKSLHPCFPSTQSKAGAGVQTGAASCNLEFKERRNGVITGRAYSPLSLFRAR